MRRERSKSGTRESNCDEFRLDFTPCSVLPDAFELASIGYARAKGPLHQVPRSQQRPQYVSPLLSKIISISPRNSLTLYRIAPHAVTAHSEAPQAIIDAFPSFLKKLSASTKLNATSSSSPPVKKAAPSLLSIDELDLPLRMQRARYAPTQAEIEAVEVR